jgi:hypothetical protein
MERLRALQEALTDAKTAAAFGEIAKSMFPKVNIEQYQDKLTETTFALTELGKASAASFDPDRVALTAEYNGELNNRARELAQLLEVAAKQLKPDEFYKLWTQLKASNEKFKLDLAAQNKLKEEQLRLDKARNSLQEALNRTRSLQESTADSQLRTRLRLEGMSPELIDAEVQKEQARRALADSLQNPDTRAAAQAALGAQTAAIDAEALAKLAENDPLTGLLAKWKAELKDTRGMVASLSQTVQGELAGAMSTAVNGVITGTTTVQEAFATLFQNISKAFIDMAMQIIAKQMTMYVLQTLLRALGAVSGGGGAHAPSNIFDSAGINASGGLAGFGLTTPILGRAVGGPVTSGTPYVVGERGPELFVPGASGSIVPNSALGGGTVVNGGINITVENTGDRLGPEAQKQIARQVQTIVMGTLVNERRSGGVLR